MTFEQLLQENTDAIVQRWLAPALSAYPADSAALFKRRTDPFANPVGHSLRQGTQGIFEALLDGADAARIHQHLHEIIKIRAVQQFSASQAVGFVFLLKQAVRAELPNAADDPQLAVELAKLDEQIDRIALAAFDLFVQQREQVYELRVNEVKRSVSWIVEKMNQRDREPEPARNDPALECPTTDL